MSEDKPTIKKDPFLAQVINESNLLKNGWSYFAKNKFYKKGKFVEQTLLGWLYQNEIVTHIQDLKENK